MVGPPQGDPSQVDQNRLGPIAGVFLPRLQLGFGLRKLRVGETLLQQLRPVVLECRKEIPLQIGKVPDPFGPEPA